MTSTLITQEFVNTMHTRLKAAIVGLEVLTDQQVADYLNRNPTAVQRCQWMPQTITAAMVAEVRKL